ncbi:YceI family protein [Mucisphaera calidilacus]|uniref:Lipid/polyisoprenoid-binding YceI-like domain-containing protein n=1 Tax=Mucisphaera calidilacus TaxID=2527982 RepID=A0A518BY74_9BACT|nr:YceI family protein [Mucisphaera calidilacus]QDU71922.1 hypothetical protein Pan265_17810 [Mucisphaera calidilacus]
MLRTLASAALTALIAAPTIAADDYALDTAHTAIVFKVDHAGRSFTWGNFNQIEGNFTIDNDNPANSSFAFTVAADSIDTNHRQRDNHLRGPDFFNVRRYPDITLNSTSVQPIDDGLRVTADITLLGTTRPVTFDLTKLGEGESRGKTYVGYDTQLTIKRSEFGMDYGLGGIGDDVTLFVSFEGER